MKKTLRRLGGRFAVIAILTLSAMAVVFAMTPGNQAMAANPTTINFQGKVVNTTGSTNVSTGSHSFVFRIYNTASPVTTTACTSTASCLWQETQGTVTVTDGTFQVELGSSCALTSTSCNNTASGGIPANWSSSSLYLTMQFDSDAAGFMSPTIHLTSVPFALNADNLGGIAATGFIQNVTSPQSANIDVQAATSGSVAAVIAANASGSGDILDLKNGSNVPVATFSSSGAVLLKNSTNSATAFQVQNAVGTQLFNIDSAATPNLLTNASVEQAISGNWTAKGTTPTTFAQDASQQYIGGQSLKITTQATPDQGATQTIALTNGTVYYLSFYAKLGTGNAFATLGAGFINSGADNACSLNSTTVVTTGWTRYSCSFTAGASSTAIYIKQTDGVIHTWYVDAVQLQTVASTPYQEGLTSINGIISSPTVFKNQSDSTTGFEIQNTTGTSNIFVVDTTNSRIGIGTNQPDDVITIAPPSNNIASLGLRSTAGAGAEIDLGQTGAYGASIGFNRSIVNALEITLGNTTTGTPQSGGNTVVTLSSIGGALFQNKTDSATAFQIQNAAGKSLFNVDTTGSDVELGKIGSGGINGSLVFNTNNAANTAITIVASGSTTTGYTLTLPVSGPAVSQCLQTDASVATQLKFASCGVGGGGTLASTYNSAATTGNTIALASAGGAVVIQDAVSTVGTLFSVQTNGGGELLGVDGSGTSAVSLYTNDSGAISWANNLGEAGGSTRLSTTAVAYNGKIYYWGGSTTGLAAGAVNTMDTYDVATNTWTTGISGGASTARISSSGTLYDGKIYYFGGTNVSNTAVKTLDIYTISTGVWSTGNAAGCIERAGHTGVAYNGKLYFWGGRNLAGTVVNSMDVYDIAANTCAAGTGGGSARQSAGAVVYSGKMYTFKGRNGGNSPTNSLDIYDFTAGSWSVGTSAPSSTASVSAVGYSGKAYVYGGQNGNLYITSTLEIYDFAANSWTTGTSGPTTRNAPVAAVVNNRMYEWSGTQVNNTSTTVLDVYDMNTGLWNGFTNTGGLLRTRNVSAIWNGKIYYLTGTVLGSASTSIDIYDTATNSWSTGLSGGVARTNASAQVYNGKIYVWGGLSGGLAVNSIDIYDIASNTWAAGTPGGTARSAMSSVVYNGKIYFWGGTTSNSGAAANGVNTMDVYDIAVGTWTTTFSTGGGARSGQTAVIYNGKMYAWGGVNTSGTALNTMDTFDIPSTTWTASFSTGGNARSAHTSVINNGKIYFWGGLVGGVYSSTVDIFDIATSGWSVGPSGNLPRGNGSAQVWGNTMYAWGGEDSVHTGINILELMNLGTQLPEILVLGNGNNDPTGQNGAIYFNSDTNKLRCFSTTMGWQDCNNRGSSFISINASGTGSSSAHVISDTALTSGTMLQITAPDPQVNANSGVLTSGKLINISSADHTYLSLDNRDLSFGGHKNQISISNIQNVYVYDTTSDRDGGRWTSDERALSSSWYNETKDNAGSACVIGTNDRCGTSTFPSKAILVVAGGTGANTLYIFDAQDNSLWMSFTQNAGATVAMGVNANNTMSSVYALNGNIYVGTNGSAATGAYEINFKTDKITRYNATDARDYSSTIAGRNTSQTTPYPDQSRTGVKLVSVTVNDIFAQIVNGKTYIVAANGNGTAANGGVSLINETSQSTTNFGPANENYQSLWYTSDDVIYGLSSTSSELDAWYSASSSTGNNIAKSTFYDETTKPALSNGASAPTINTGAPDALYVTNGTSDADGQSNTMYVGHNNGLSVIEEKVGAETGGAVKNYNTNYISEELFGDIRNFLPLNGSGVLTNNSNLTDQSVKANALTVKNANGTGITYGSGVRGTAITGLDNTDDYICTGTTGTCADDNDLDPTATGNFSIGAWVKRSATGTAPDVIMAKWGNAAADQAYRLQFSATDIPTCEQGSGAATVTTTGPALTDTTGWHYLTCVFDNDNNIFKIFVDGIQVGSQATASSNGGASTVAYTVGADLSGAANAAANFYRGSIDEPFVTMSALSGSQVRFMYDVGSRALNNPNHASSSSIRGVSVAADGANTLNGSSVVKAVRPMLGTGLLYIGTSGGVSVEGIDTDTLVDLYSTSITSKDDINTNYDATNGNAVNTLSVSKGFGTGNLITIGFNNAGAGGIWSEISSTGLLDFFGNSYDPFGDNLVQTNLSVDRVFRVTNQISTRLDNFSMATTNMPQIYDLLRVDSNGLTVAPGSAIIGTTTMKSTDISGNTIFSVRTMGTNFGSLVAGGGFETKMSYWGQEYNIVQGTTPPAIVGSATPSACSWARGDQGGHLAAIGTCTPTTDISMGLGDMTLAAANQAATTDSCTVSNPGGLNGLETLTSLTSVTAGHSDVCAEYPTGAALGVSRNFISAGSLPVMAMKLHPNVANSTGNRWFAGMWSGGKPAVATTLPGTAASTWGVYFTNCTATTPTCANNTLQGWVVNASTTLVGSVSCPNVSNSATQYYRIEFRSINEVHFYYDSDVSNGTYETECGNGVTSTSALVGGNMTPFVETAVTNSAVTLNESMDIDYLHIWQDDAPTESSSQQQSGSNADTPIVDNSLQSTAPLTPDSTDPTNSSNFFNFIGATSDDTVFNHDVYVHGTLYADKIKANQIEGLSVFTDQLASLQKQLALTPSTDSDQTSPATTSNTVINTPQNLLTLSDGLSVGGDASFHGNVLFYKLVTFTEKTIFNNDVTFAGHIDTAGATPHLDVGDSAGITTAPPDNPDANLVNAKIDGNDNNGEITLTAGDGAVAGEFVTINFASPYDKPPHIFLTAANDQSAQLRYYVSATKTGFKIIALDQPTAGSIYKINYWVAQSQ